MLIVVGGMIGLGKSSVAQILGENFKSDVFYESVDENPILPLFYGKDEDASMIDPIFNRHPYNYHEVVEEQRRNGTLKKRKRPQEEIKYAGMDKGTVIWNEDPFYIIQSDKRYIVAIRITLYYWSGTVTNNDLLMGDFKEEGEISIDNITRNETGFHVKIVHIGNDLQSCQDWLNENIFNNQ